MTRTSQRPHSLHAARISGPINLESSGTHATAHSATINSLHVRRPICEENMKLSARILCLFLASNVAATSAIAQHPARWSPEKANAWYAQQPWLVGANYVPSDAINQLEMFQAATWNPQLNDKELGMAQS